MHKLIKATAVIFLAASLAACGAQGASLTSGKYKKAPKMAFGDYPKVDGSTSHIPLALALMQEITGCTEAEAESVTAFTRTNPSHVALSVGEADILIAYEASEPTKKDIDNYASFEIQPIGTDALVFLVNEDNPVQSITSDELRGIYTGIITNWKHVGGSDQEIMAFQRNERSGSQALMQKLVMGDIAMVEPSDDLVEVEMSRLINAIGSFDASANAIGFSVFYYANNMYEVPGVRLIAVDGIMPSNETIKSGEYPHTDGFFCVLPDNPTTNARKIADWLISDEGQAFIMEKGYVPVR